MWKDRKQERKMIRNYWLRAGLITAVFLLGVGAGILGMKEYTRHTANQSNADKKAEELITDKIAIVNLDNGVMVKGEIINYAGKLLVNLDDNFLFTGLEDARTGYASGLYAGYLIIPATFSESIVSLNDTPIRAEIAYAINNELREDVKENTIYDVLNLVSELNNNISYMYLHSLMEEFHDAQDEADVVMKNDLEEKEAINAIQSEDLVALVPVTKITEIENNIEPVDISEYISKNAELTSEVGIKYTEYIMESETEHQAINEEATALMTEMGNMDTIIGGIDLSHDAEGNSIYQKGADELQTLFEEHNAKLENKEEDLLNNVLTIYTDIQTYLKEYQRAKEAYQLENEQKYLNTLTDLQKLFDEYQDNYIVVSEEAMAQLETEIIVQNEQIEVVNEQIQELQGMANGNEAEEPEEDAIVNIMTLEELSEIPSVNMPETEDIELSELQKEMQQVLADNYYIFEGYLLDENGEVKKDQEENSILLTSLLDKYTLDLSREELKNEVFNSQIGEIERMDIASATTIVDEKVLLPIQERVDSITTAILDQYAVEKEQLSAFSNSVMEYNPLEYIDHEEIQRLTGAMFDNGTELSEAIMETDIQQMEYVADVYEATRTDLANMQDSIAEAKEASDQAVADGLAELKEVKNANSEKNQEIMYDFSEKLPYTRLGSLEYRQAYEFMANPLTYRELDDNKEKINTESDDSVKIESDSIRVSENRQKDYEIIGMIICAMICVIIVGTTIKYHFHKKEEELFES